MGRIRSPILRNSLIAVALVAGTSGWVWLDSYARSHGFFINRSPSLPNWAYYFERGKAVKRGEVAFFAPPSNPLVHAHFGAEPPVFGKIVYGLPGDTVSHRGADVSRSSTWTRISRMLMTQLRPAFRQSERFQCADL